LLEYISGNAYTICITKNIDHTILQNAGARSILELSPEQKMHPAMAKGIFPSWAVRTPGMVDVWISFPRTVSFDEIKNYLRSGNIEITSTQYSKYNVIGLRIIRNRLNEVASIPFIEYMEPAPHGDQKLNYIAKQNSRGNVLNASIGVGGYNLKGDGVVVGVGDDADPQYHVDFTGRLIDFGPAGYFYHGTHVYGTVGGGGTTGIRERRLPGATYFVVASACCSSTCAFRALRSDGLAGRFGALGLRSVEFGRLGICLRLILGRIGFANTLAIKMIARPVTTTDSANQMRRTRRHRRPCGS